jgi:DNA-binding NarL/FixJ family response regulator
MRGWEDRALRFQQDLQTAARSSYSLPDGLTPREAEILRLIAHGLKNHEIAGELVVSIATVERHISNLYRKINARGRAEAVSYALAHHLDQS